MQSAYRERGDSMANSKEIFHTQLSLIREESRNQNLLS